MGTPISLLQEFGLSFVPLFVAMDAISVIPFLLPLTEGMQPSARSRVTRMAMITAFVLGLGFVAIGKGIFVFLGITINDFLVAGGLFLFLLAAKEMLTGKMIDTQTGTGSDTMGVVPLGTPLVVGPAVLTTLLILVDQFNIIIVILAFVLNILIAWLFFAQADRIIRILGQAGVKAIGKVMGLFLAAIAVKMVHGGIVGLFAGL